MRVKTASRHGAAICAIGLWIAALPTHSSCHSGDTLRAKQIEHRAELVGGPVSVADIGDYLLENDQIRVAILGGRNSPGPGVYGGSIVDIDRRRPFIGYEGGQGLDRFAESFPVANLIVPDPTETDVTVLSDGSDGREAAIRVEGEGEFLFEAIGLLRAQEDVLGVIFPGVRTRIRFRSDYALHPGERFITMRTTLLLTDDPPGGCAPVTSCPPCPDGYQQDANGCLSCACSEVLPLDPATEPISVFGSILGDPTTDPAAPAVRRTGVVAGDFVFFGNQNDVFAPGPGFDEDTGVQDAFNAGQNSFSEPLTYDFVAAAGGDISYGYFTKTPPGAAAQSVVNVPIFASAATAFLIGNKNCLFDTADDAACDAHRAFTYERYLVAGDGDVNSVTEEMYRARGTPTGTVRGHVVWESTLEPIANARLFVFSDPEPGRAWASLGELLGANRDARGDVGLVNAIDADLGLDRSEDGDFRGVLPPGDYVLVARDPSGTVMSAPIPVKVAAGEERVLTAAVPQPAVVRYRITDEAGQGVPAKLSFVALGEDGQPLPGDGRRRVFMGEGRLGNGVRMLEASATGEGEVRVEPGRYRVLASRGPEYGVHRADDVELGPGQIFRFDGVVVREVDTAGWMSTDIHLHSRPSFDSGMPIERRVTAAAAEHVELAVSTDHDVQTDYRPAVRALDLAPFITAAVGAEITTLEQGHFIGFPFVYDELDVPGHGSHNWTCQAGGEILSAIKGLGDGTVSPLAIMAHPRDGFFGYIDQLGVDTFTLNRKPALLVENNPIFRTAGCNFEAMEIINGKRFDLVRTPSVAEAVDWTRCLSRLNEAQDPEGVAAACAEEPGFPPAGFALQEGERFVDFKRRARTALAWVMMKRLLARTPEEQDRSWFFAGDSDDSRALCDLGVLGEGPIPTSIRDEPCAYRAGHIDDYFRYLDHGLIAAQIASSDSHGPIIEPGSPRTYFLSPTDAPGSLAIPEAVESLRAGQALATYGPFIRASVKDRTFGQLAAAAPGEEVELRLEVQTASWFGVDRIEVYVNGRMVRLIEPAVPPSEIVDARGKVTFAMPDRDSWVVIIAMGLRDENLMSPIALDVPFGELQLARLASDGFSKVPVISSLFPLTPSVPDWSPVLPYAVTNAIFIDSDGNGKYNAPRPFPQFCSRPCDPSDADPGQCPTGQTCLPEERVCGFPIPGRCDHRRLGLRHTD
ncbi:MAG TPA: hypothetical protein VLS89_03335 [Candidatus Nanopelagicales bacterium]|nr:hypothetical protein [Candidatus Nanopelagicales bacterium]